MTLTQIKEEILRNLGLPLTGDTDLTDAVLDGYVIDAHAQLAEDTFCYRRQLIVPTVKSYRKTIVCTFSQAPSNGATFIVGSTSLGQTTYTWEDTDISGTNKVLLNANYVKNMVDAINGVGQGTTCSATLSGYQTFVAEQTSALVITLTGITYDATLNTTSITGTTVSESGGAVITSPTNGFNGLIYTIPDDVIHIAKVSYGGSELHQTSLRLDDIYNSSYTYGYGYFTPEHYDRYSTNQIIIDGYNAGQHPLIIDVNIIPSSVANGIPLITVTPFTPYGIPEMYHRILIYLVTARVLTELFADTIDGAQIRIQTAYNMANMLTTKFKAGLIAW